MIVWTINIYSLSEYTREKFLLVLLTILVPFDLDNYGEAVQNAKISYAIHRRKFDLLKGGRLKPQEGLKI